jgi:arylsulfatase A-like enzyme
MWQALRWGYYRLIEKVDAEIGKVLDALQAAGLEDNTLIVFTADHGECAGACVRVSCRQRAGCRRL